MSGMQNMRNCVTSGSDFSCGLRAGMSCSIQICKISCKPSRLAACCIDHSCCSANMNMSRTGREIAECMALAEAAKTCHGDDLSPYDTLAMARCNYLVHHNHICSAASSRQGRQNCFYLGRCRGNLLKLCHKTVLDNAIRTLSGSRTGMHSAWLNGLSMRPKCW